MQFNVAEDLINALEKQEEERLSHLPKEEREYDEIYRKLYWKYLDKRMSTGIEPEWTEEERKEVVSKTMALIHYRKNAFKRYMQAEKEVLNGHKKDNH